MKGSKKLALISICAIILSASTYAAVKAFDVSFYLTNMPGGSETTTFKRGETVYIYALPPPGGATLSIEIRLLYPPETGRPPITLLARRTLQLSAPQLLAEHKIQETDPEGAYAIRISAINLATGESRDIDLSFVVGTPVPWELIVPLVVIAVVGAAGFLVVRQRRSQTIVAVQPAAPARVPGVETQVVEPGTIRIIAPSGETMLLTAILQAGTQNIPVTRLPQEFGRSDFVNVAPREVINAISRRHFMISYDYAQGRFLIYDLGSTNGTYVNGVDIRGKGSVPLKNGDRINVGGVLDLVFITSPAGYSESREIFTPGEV